MDSEVTVTVQGLSAEQVAEWLERLRAVGLVPMAGGRGRVRETIGRPGHFMARSVPSRNVREFGRG